MHHKENTGWWDFIQRGGASLPASGGLLAVFVTLWLVGALVPPLTSFSHGLLPVYMSDSVLKLPLFIKAQLCGIGGLPDDLI